MANTNCNASGSLLSSPYDKIIDMIKGLDLQDDGILMNQKIKSIEIDFCNIVRNENMLNESMDYINHKALSDGETSLKFALLFSSRIFDSLAMNDTKVRSKMLTILEQNFRCAEILRIENKDRLYNSITLLGEYYHRVRLADNAPIRVLGESLIGLLIREVCEDNMIDIKLARLILSQITLNGDIMRAQHMGDLTQLLYHVRRNLIEQPNLQSSVKALLLMTLDLFYSNFSNLGHQLEEMYTKYLVEESNSNSEIAADEIENHSANSSFQNSEHENAATIVSSINYGNGTDFNDSISTIATAAGEINSSETKKWSEQVCEESFLEHESYSLGGDNMASAGQRQNKSFQQQQQQQQQQQPEQQHDNEVKNDENGFPNQQPYLDHQERQKHPKSFSPDRFNSSKQNRQQLPRWRAPRFNRGGSEQDERSFMSITHNNRNNNRRLSGNFDDDHNSVRSEGGSIRLYSVNDRLKHLQDKSEREQYHGNGSGDSRGHYHSHSNWDHGNDRRNFERHNHRNRGGGGGFVGGGSGGGSGRGNNRHTYNRPPRFMKKNHNQAISGDNNGGGNHDLQWRSSSGHTAMSASYHEENSYTNGADDTHSRSSSRAQTLPRPPKTNFNDKIRRSQSPTYNKSGFNNNSNNNNTRNYRNINNNENHLHFNHRPQQSRNFNRNQRYSSQSSLASSETATNTLDRRHHQRNYKRELDHENDWEDTHSLHGQPEESNWNSKDNNRELVLNARNTTKYMNYLSQK